MAWFKTTKQDVLDGIGEPRLRLLQEGCMVWVLMYLPTSGKMVRKAIRIRRVSDAPLEWWVERGKEMLAGDASDVTAPKHDDWFK